MKPKAELISRMNNTKWYEFFNAVDENVDIPWETPVLVKYIDCDELVKEQLTFGGVLHKEGIHEYWMHPNDSLQYKLKRFATWIYFRDIEWLFFPTVVEQDIYTKQTRNSPLVKTDTWTIETDILEIKKLIDNLGKLDYGLTDDGLKLYGYRRVERNGD